MSDLIRLKNLVTDAMNAILVEHDRAKVRGYFHGDFVQHNPWSADGSAHVEAMCDFSFGVKMNRWAIQGDIVAYHGLYTAPNPLGEHPLLCVDLWRVQGEQIVEHWDALQPMPAEVAELMIAGAGDGLAEVAPSRVAANAARARRLFELGVNKADRELITSLLAASFTVHRPKVTDGREAFTSWAASSRPSIAVKRTVASGDLVFAQLLVEIAGAEQVVYEILRFNDDGRITDQWTVAQDRVPLSEAANPHPHF
ncbi:MAG: nuclear transport factor 2 family protein [Myxococcota bacterium]